ncbi:hypothetical protein MZD04_gp034 [Pseudomonas phage Psa21]|uniref:Uncharacterized protein n=1 Tax=Pseudomonas phage Psa21 TaxID=2530023 RepID=A0A481W5A5_9CAUD|nr:hypothetical protein MZD04_gp034 [Pseudomonas phage Psa21]QBJ02564.1 hypothetical protein PSA21_34 [Pseudomonas phage Psa21]
MAPSTCVISHSAVNQVKVLARDSWKHGHHYEFNHNNETVTVLLGTKRCYIYGEQRKAMISLPRKTIEGMENLLEEDVIGILKRACELQSEM